MENHETRSHSLESNPSSDPIRSEFLDETRTRNKEKTDPVFSIYETDPQEEPALIYLAEISGGVAVARRKRVGRANVLDVNEWILRNPPCTPSGRGLILITRYTTLVSLLVGFPAARRSAFDSGIFPRVILLHSLCVCCSSPSVCLPASFFRSLSLCRPFLSAFSSCISTVFWFSQFLILSLAFPLYPTLFSKASFSGRAIFGANARGRGYSSQSSIPLSPRPPASC